MLRRYLETLQELDRAECAVALTPGGDPRAAWSYIHRQIDLLDGQGGVWETYAGRKASLVFSIISSRDQTKQIYRVLVPAGRQPAAGYPLIVYLHGAGAPESMRFAWRGFISPPAAQVVDAQGVAPIIVEPWTRGNAGVGHEGGTDVLDIIKDIGSVFPVDPDRVLLSGHSMGGQGVWMLGLYDPGRWAAIAPLSAAGDLGPLENLTGLPVRAWHGDGDVKVQPGGSIRMIENAKRLGLEAELIIGKGIGHSLPDAVQAEIFGWLLTQVRKRPNPIIFNAVGDYRQRNGITIKSVPETKQWPRFVCSIKDATVDIQSTGATGLDIDLGPAGLGYPNSASVTVKWNGKEVYQGMPKVVSASADQ
ncbi:hypothetical protein LBMAG53_35010 [Planctomycetota bacterium]|nr:hypothetical protein LBMAG53_35010 [Planctomycetota bacterium]